MCYTPGPTPRTLRHIRCFTAASGWRSLSNYLGRAHDQIIVTAPIANLVVMDQYAADSFVIVHAVRERSRHNPCLERLRRTLVVRRLFYLNRRHLIETLSPRRRRSQEIPKSTEIERVSSMGTR